MRIKYVSQVGVFAYSLNGEVVHGCATTSGGRCDKGSDNML